MSAYENIVRTNYFRVTDEKRYKELCENLSGNLDFANHKSDDSVLHSFGGYGPVNYWLDDCDKCGYPISDFDEFLAEIQKIMPDDDAFIYYDIGHERDRGGLIVVAYVLGEVTIVTKKDIQKFSVNYS